MAVVTKYGTGARDPAADVNIDNIYAGGHVKALRSSVAIASGDSIASRLVFGNIPSNALIDPDSLYAFGAITGLTDFDLGFAYPNGTVIDGDCLVEADDLATAGTQTLRGHGSVTLAESLLRAWQIAGLTADPGGHLTVIGTLNAAAGAAGVIDLNLRYNVA